jgi:hypothetical protein
MSIFIPIFLGEASIGSANEERLRGGPRSSSAELFRWSSPARTAVPRDERVEWGAGLLNTIRRTGCIVRSEGTGWSEGREHRSRCLVFQSQRSLGGRLSWCIKGRPRSVKVSIAFSLISRDREYLDVWSLRLTASPTTLSPVDLAWVWELVAYLAKDTRRGKSGDMMGRFLIERGCHDAKRDVVEIRCGMSPPFPIFPFASPHGQMVLSPRKRVPLTFSSNHRVRDTSKHQQQGRATGAMTNSAMKISGLGWISITRETREKRDVH